jgi:hypothetical protein
VPDAAASLSQIADGEAHVPEASGLELHLLEQLVGQALVVLALAGQPAQLLKAPGQGVAGALELIEPQERRPVAGALPRGRGRGRGRYEREALGDDRRELALEPSDLGAQRLARLALAV